MAEAHDARRANTWGELFLQAVELGLGAATLTVETAQKVVNDLVRRGEVTKEEGPGLVERLMQMGREQREQLGRAVEHGVENAMIRMDLARRSDLEVLRQRVAHLEQAVLGQAAREEPIPPISEAELADNI